MLFKTYGHASLATHTQNSSSLSLPQCVNKPAARHVILSSHRSAQRLEPPCSSRALPCVSSPSSSTRCRASTSSSSSDTSDPQPSSSGRTDTTAQAAQNSDLVTFEEMQEIAAARGLHLSLKNLGPFYRITCRDGNADGRILGVTNGFVAPLFGLMHCDTLQIFTRGMKGDEGDRVRKNPLGLGLLLGGAVFSYGRSCGCRKAEILAINDDDSWHERLVRYYSYFGFKPVCKVGGQGFFKDVPHLLVWGGEGTRMDADIEDALLRWTPALRQSRQKAQQQQQQQQRQRQQQAPAAGSSKPAATTQVSS